MLSAKEIENNINELMSLNQQRRAKYYRNLSFYNGTRKTAMEAIKNPTCVGYNVVDFNTNNDTTPTPSLNVIKSIIDTLHSQIAESKVRPFFNCVNGSYKDICIVKQAQQFFDQYFDIEDVNKKVSEAFRDACIFDTGYVYIDPDNKAITRALPWQVYERPAELTYNNITRTYYRRSDYPVSMLPKEIIKEAKIKNQLYVNYGVYYDVLNKTKAHCIPELKYMKIEEFDGNRTPFVRINYDNPISGNTSVSIVDMLFAIQMQINILMDKRKDAAQLNPANTIAIPKGAGIKTGQLNNRIGNVIEYEAGNPNMTANPISVITPSFIDGQYKTEVDDLVEKAYRLTGVSQLSANSMKPAGLNSGVALQTMENIEAGRFQTQLNQVVRAYTDIAKTCLRIFPKNENILPEDNMRLEIKWKDIVEETQKMQIQFSGADALSKDPSTKLQQLIALSQSGVIPKSRISQFMEIPDIDSGYSLANNAINAVLSTIDDCINNHVYEVPDYIPLEMLEEEILNTQLSLRGANYEKNKEAISDLEKLYCVVEKKKEETMAQAAMEQQIQATAGQAVSEAMGEAMDVGDPNANLPIGPESEETPDINNIPADKDAYRSDLDVSTNNNKKY